MEIEVGVDVGGTFTDAAVATDREVVRAKAHTTTDVTSGILDVLSRARQQLELGEAEFFGSVRKFVLGNTIVTNVIDELHFPAVGLLTTAGFRHPAHRALRPRAVAGRAHAGDAARDRAPRPDRRGRRARGRQRHGPEGLRHRGRAPGR